MRLLLVRLLILAVASAGLTACGGGGGDDHQPPPVPAVTASVTVTSPVARIYEGDTVQLVATARDAAGNVLSGKATLWSSDHPESFPVSGSGGLQAWGVGPVTVTASIEGVSGSLPLSVVPIEVQVAVGAREVVLDYTTDRCADNETPDGPARFV